MIEDDEELASLLTLALKEHNIKTTIATDPINGLEILASKEHFDALVLDLSLPEMDGLEVCEQARKTHPNLPILISSARSETIDKITGFKFGADDYLAKPYEPVELAFRLRAVLRRGLNAPLNKRKFSIDKDRYTITKDNKEIILARSEFEIFAYLFEHEGYAISREDLLLNIDSIKFQSGLKSIDVMISRLRAHIGDDPKNPRFIHSVRGVGYKFSDG